MEPTEDRHIFFISGVHNEIISLFLWFFKFSFIQLIWRYEWNISTSNLLWLQN